MKDTPLRMCIVCRQMKQKQELVRVVKNKEGEVFIDPTFKANGRGAYVCKDQQCIQKCIKTLDKDSDTERSSILLHKGLITIALFSSQ